MLVVEPCVVCHADHLMRRLMCGASCFGRGLVTRGLGAGFFALKNLDMELVATDHTRSRRHRGIIP
jgi:hypothetical protein